MKLLKQNVHFILLFFIISLALFLRVFDLSSNPIGLNQDEAVNGYDAYSISKTLKDHHGNFLPPMLESYEDWASPLITYVTVPFVMVLGLSEFSIRLPVALLGVGTVLVLYFLLRQFFHNKNLALLGAFLLAIMPWHITLSRWAIPPSIVPFFLLAIISSFLWARKSQKWYAYLLTGIFAALTTYSYPTQKMFIPLLLAALVLSFFHLRKDWKKIFVIGVTYIVLIAPIYLLTFSNPAKYNARFNDVSITTLKDTNIVSEFVPRYLAYFTPFFNFGTGDHDTMHHVPGIGSSYEFMSVFFYLGILVALLMLYKKDFLIFDKRVIIFLLLWLVLFPIPAALTRDYMHILRAVHGFPIVIFFSILGLNYLYNLFSDKSKIKYFSGMIVFVGLASLLNFAYIYFGPYIDLSRRSYQYGIKDYMSYALANENKYDDIIVDIKINNPYIYYLFYSKYNPENLNYSEINATVDGKGGWKGVPKIGKYKFQEIMLDEIVEPINYIQTVKANEKDFYYIYEIGKTLYIERAY